MTVSFSLFSRERRERQSRPYGSKVSDWVTGTEEGGWHSWICRCGERSTREWMFWRLMVWSAQGHWIDKHWTSSYDQ